MRRFVSAVIVSSVLLLLSASSASAQTWTGFYIGAHVGTGFNTPDFTAPETGPAYNGETIFGPVSAGFNFGGNLGYTREVASRIVVGVDFSIGLNRFSGEGFAGPDDDTRGFTQGGLQWTAMGRAGYAFNNVLPYFTIGVVNSRTSVEVVDECTASPCGPGEIDATGSGSASSLIWGFGVQFGNASRPWSVRGEWLLSDFRIAAPASGEAFGGTTFTWGFDTHFPKSVVRVLFDYRFGG